MGRLLGRGIRNGPPLLYRSTPAVAGGGRLLWRGPAIAREGEREQGRACRCEGEGWKEGARLRAAVGVGLWRGGGKRRPTPASACRCAMTRAGRLLVFPSIYIEGREGADCRHRTDSSAGAHRSGRSRGRTPRPGAAGGTGCTPCARAGHAMRYGQGRRAVGQRSSVLMVLLDGVADALL